MPDQSVTLRGVSWRDCCPWLMLFRTFSLAASPVILLLATAALVGDTAGWRVCSVLFDSATAYDSHPNLEQSVDTMNQWPSERDAFTFDWSGDTELRENVTTGLTSGEIARVWQRVSQPFRLLFAERVGLRSYGYLIAGCVWSLLVWSFFGAAIARSAALRLTIDERVSLKKLLGFAREKFFAFFAAPFLALLAVFAISILAGVIFGLLAKTDLLLVVAAVLWPLMLIAGLLIVILLLGIALGWPLMWGTIASEGTDGFDALSRSYGYTFQRPLHYAFYVAVALAYGALCSLVVSAVAGGAIHFSYWSLSWGTELFVLSDGEVPRIEQIQNVIANDRATSGTLWAGTGLIEFWNGAVLSVARAFAYSYFWVAATAIYLLLRRDVDQAELDEIYLDDEDEPVGMPGDLTNVETPNDDGMTKQE